MSAHIDTARSSSSPTRDGRDLEAQNETPQQQNAPSDKGLEYTIPTHTKLIALGGYFLLSLALTLQSKMILGKVWEIWSSSRSLILDFGFGCGLADTGDTSLHSPICLPPCTLE